MNSTLMFFRLWIWFSLRHLIVHRWRTLAVLVGIALGAAVFTSVRLAINASLDSFVESVDTLAGKADWTVVRPGGRVPEGLVPEILRCTGVQTVSPLLSSYIQSDGKNSEPFLLIGLDPILDRSFRNFEAAPEEEVSNKNSTARIPWLDFIAQPGTLLASRKLAESRHLAAGSLISLRHMDRKADFRVLGVLEPKGLGLAEGGEIALTDISSMQELTGQYGLVDRIDIRLDPEASEADLQTVRSLLPPGVTLAPPTESRESGQLMIRAYSLNLSVLSFVSLFVGMFLVYSLVALNATSRRHELAVLRSLGACPRMLFLLFLAEGAFFGVVGWALAIPLGSFMVKRMLSSVSATITHLFVRVKVDQLILDSWELALSFLITLFISLLAAYQPAREAMRVPPREAFWDHGTNSGQHKSTRQLAQFGLVLILLVWPLSELPSTGGMPLPGYIATFFLFVGFSLLSPWCLQFMGSHIPPLLRRFGGQPAYLGGRYVRDAGTRIAISVGALITAVALFVALVTMIHSFRHTVEAWVNQSIKGDVFLRPMMAGVNRYRDPLPEEVVVRLQNLQDRMDLLPYRRIYLQYGNISYLFEAIDFTKFARHGSFLLIEGDSREIMPKLAAGRGTLVSEVFSNQTGLKSGDRFRAQIEGVNLDEPILGIFRDYRTKGGVVHYSLPHFQGASGDRSWSGVGAFMTHPGGKTESKSDQPTQEPLLDALRTLSERYDLEMTVGRDLRKAIMRIFDETFAITTVLLIIALFVAALGITTTLTVLVLERTRELNTLRAIGAAAHQIRSMIFWEAVLMVTAGELMGAGCGFILSYLLVYVINRQSFGWTFVYRADWASLLASMPLILVTALMSAIPAAEMAFRQSPAEVLRER